MTTSPQSPQESTLSIRAVHSSDTFSIFSESPQACVVAKSSTIFLFLSLQVSSRMAQEGSAATPQRLPLDSKRSCELPNPLLIDLKIEEFAVNIVYF